MAIVYDELMAMDFADREFVFSKRDTMLYALGVGMGREMPADLPFVYERDLVALPTQAAVVAWDASWQDLTGIDVAGVVHGEMRITMHRPLPAAGRVRAKLRVRDVFDKGPGRGAVVLAETAIRDAASGEPIATLLSTVFARSDGGFGGPPGRGPEPVPVPARPPDHVVAFETRPEQALIYRLCGDDNPLHVDPRAAGAAGFERPILHGLCSYGIAAAAVVKTACGGRVDLIRHIEARFTAPVFPGETLVNELWLEDRAVSFRTRVPARDVIALDHGRALLSED